MVSSKFFLSLALCLCSASLFAQHVEMKSEGRDTAYVNRVIARATKNIDPLNLKGAAYDNVLNIVCNRYFELFDIYEERDSLMSKPETKSIAKAFCDSKLYRSHFSLTASLSIFLTPQQIEQVKDGITMGVVPRTYNAYIEMIPRLTKAEKSQIMAWLEEARELALDAESSKKKHEVFGKYKGRINNYLAARGYDLKREREEWYKRMDADNTKNSKNK